MTFKIKNKTYQPLMLIIDEKHVTLGPRKTMKVGTITKQMKNLESRGFLQIIKIQEEQEQFL